jgi:hypothetical protein
MEQVAEMLDSGGPVAANVTWIVCFPGISVTVTLGEKQRCVHAEVKLFCWRGGTQGSDGCVAAKGADEFL